MTLSMYQASVPALIHGLENLKNILAKAAAHAEAKRIDPGVLLNARLFPDMFPLSRQVQITSDVTKYGIARLASMEVPSYPDTETTFPELLARVQKTIDFVKTASAAQIDGTEGKDITLTIGGKDMKFTGQNYLFQFVLPNFYFHISIAYGILRECGLELGKSDYLGKIQ